MPLPEALLPLSLLDALHADEQLDVESIARNLTDNPELKNKAMSLAQQLIAQGRMEGKPGGKFKQPKLRS